MRDADSPANKLAMLNDPGDGDAPSGDAVNAFLDGDHRPLARVLDKIAETLPQGSVGPSVLG